MLARRLTICLTLVLPFMAPGPMAAQRPDTTRTKGLCLHPQPRPACRNGLITEFSVATPILGSDTAAVGDGHPKRTELSAEFGVLHNTGPRAAIGGSAAFGWSEASALAAFRLRYRRWLGPELSVDLAPGWLMETETLVSGAGLRVAVSARDVVTAFVEPRLMGGKAKLYAGGALGSGLGAGALVLTTILLVVALGGM